MLAGVRREKAWTSRSCASTFNPLVVWVWAGGFVMMVGGLIVMWPAAATVQRMIQRPSSSERCSPLGALAFVLYPIFFGVARAARSVD